MSRVRRATVKAINYAKEQEFSDAEDVFEEEPEEELAPKRRGRPRKSTGIDIERHEIDEAEDYRPSAPVFTEKGYDPTLPPIRERFSFMPEYELDGSPRIELIVGRRPVDDKNAEASDEETPSEESQDSDDGGKRKSRKKQDKKKQMSPKKRKESPEKDTDNLHKNEHVEYEYLVKYKGRSYLHLDWKTGADLESMNKSAKTLYRRFLKKLAAGVEEDLEDPDFDPSFAIPQKIVDVCEQEITLELTDKELVDWEKEQKQALAEEEATTKAEGMELEGEDIEEKKEEALPPEKEATKDKEAKEMEDDIGDFGDPDEDIDFSTLTLDKLRKIVIKEGPYYPVIEGCDNPYRDGYITEPPKKPRSPYLFFQCTMRSYFTKRNPGASLGELQTIVGDTWKAMTEQEQAPFIQLSREEAEQYDKERALTEKAQKPNEMWQPLRRCLMVLDRLANDSFAEIFLEPVDLDEFPDYEEVIDFPMDLGTIRQKLANKKYQAPENFARDVRKVWNNCKIYNQHGSAIWHVADYMSKQFERLYHAWVLEYRERYLRWVHPRARPWEHTCRECDGKCGAPDDKMVLCDHCDAMFGMTCLKPPLSKLPDGVWHCPDCSPKLHSVKGVRMYSAVAEQAARQRAELGDVPKRTIKQTMYLVKWAGLGYEFCTWETKEDINDDALIEEYHQLNNPTLHEPDLTEKEVHEFLDKMKHTSVADAGGIACIPDLRAQLYAQTQAFHFSKFGDAIPDTLCGECGPKTKASSLIDEESGPKAHVKEVVDCVADMAFRVSQHEPMIINASLPPLLTGEYDAIIPITGKGLMMNVGEIHGCVAFLGYRSLPDGTKGPAELNHLVRNVGDKIIAVDGHSTVNKSFKEVINLLRESGKNKYAFMRFLENKYAVCNNDLTSVGAAGIYTVDEMMKKFAGDRQRLLAQRKQQSLVEDVKPSKVEDEESDGSAGGSGNSDDESDEGSEGSFEPDSEDEKLILRETGSNVQKALPVSSPGEAKGISAPVSTSVNPPQTQSNANAEGCVRSSAETEPGSPITTKSAVELPVVVQQETTRSLAYRLLDMNVGYSSDEGGDEDCAFFLDGVDNTFSTLTEAKTMLPQGSGTDALLSSCKRKGKKQSPSKRDGEDGDSFLPAKKSHFTSLGDRAKLHAAISLTDRAPDPNDFENFPLPSQKEIDAQKKAEAVEELSAESQLTEARETCSPPKSLKRSTVKVEQVSTKTGEIVRIWANVDAAAATLQLPIDELKQLLKGEYDEDLGDEIGGYRWRYAVAGAEVTKSTDGTTRGSKKVKEAFLEFRDKLYDPAEPHIYKNGNRLRDYQVDGVNWLASTWYKRHSCILADEMGLGKTVQIVCYIEHLHRVEKIRRPYLIVVPLSTVEHWRREFLGWTDLVCCVYHDRQRVWRDVMREYEWYFEDRPHTADYLKFDVLVTTYDTLISDFDIISQIPWRVAVVDEAHRLRNIKGKLLECMKEISARGTLQYGFQSRILMTGTPLQNNTQELWTLLNFIEPFKFPSLETFQAKFGNMANREQVEALQQTISPYMLRRVKEDVAKDIPAKEETLIDVELTSIQKQYYRAIFEHNHAFLSMGATRANAPKLMNIQMELRKCCNHPFLLEGVEQRENEKQFGEFLEHGDFEGKTSAEQQMMLNEHGYVQTSGKMVLLDKLLPKLRQEGHKILIFSQMVRMLDLISEYCDFRGFRHERLDGRVRGNERQKAIDRFESDKNIFVFLLSTRAGGVGINLTAADICIIFDSDWNPQNDVQAQARCHRIGQTKDVRIYRLITSRTFEQEMFDRASKKLGLEQAVLGTFGQDDDDDKPTAKEMENLLKKGAYALIEDENDEIGKAFCADDIENILAKRTRTRVVEGAKTASWLNKQGMVVSKSRFTGDTSASATVDVDDPLFWQKVMPDFVTPTIMLTKLDELSELLEGGGPGRGRGRGRGRGKKKQKKDETKAEEATDKEASMQELDSKEEPASGPPGGAEGEKGDVEEDKEPESGGEAEEENGEDEDEEPEADVYQLSRTNQRKVHKYMSDLKSMMDGIFLDAEDESLPQSEKAICEKLLLTISIKERLFNDEQRKLARNMLKRLEGDRRRRCRTSMEQPGRLSTGTFRQADEGSSEVREELLILSKHQRKKRRQDKSAEEPTAKRSRKSSIEGESGPGYVGEDGYLHHSDSEADWSDVGEDIYKNGKTRNKISKKEAKRRRAWATEGDAATAAGRPWPALPRHLVKPILSSLLEEMIKYDESKDGIFSVPVPRDELPEYYEQIEHPMDYGTMRQKLEREEYRSAQAMQKDFILVMQNCLKFNAPGSEIVKEARQQALMRPVMLRNAAMKHKIFLAEDGSALEVYSDGEGDKDDGSPKKKRKGGKKSGESKDNEEGGEITARIPKKSAKVPSKIGKARQKSLKAGKESKNGHDDAAGSSDEDAVVNSLKKPRIQINLSADGVKAGKTETKSKKKQQKVKPQSTAENLSTSVDEGHHGDDETTPAPKSKRKREDKTESTKKISRKRTKKIASTELGFAEHVMASVSVEEDGSSSVINRSESLNGEEHEASEMDKTTSPIENDPAACYFDVDMWKQGREALDGSFKSARAHFTSRGPWQLPKAVGEGSFSHVAKQTLNKMDRLDTYSVFTEPVNEDEVPDYKEVIKNPMDFGTMRTKVENGAYGKGSDAVVGFYNDFMLVFDNCALYNDEDGEVGLEAARLLGLLPEVFAGACSSVAGKQKKPKSKAASS